MMKPVSDVACCSTTLSHAHFIRVLRAFSVVIISAFLDVPAVHQTMCGCIDRGGIAHVYIIYDG